VKVETGVKVITPVALTLYVPTFGTVTDVAVQLGEVSPSEHNLTEAASKLTWETPEIPGLSVPCGLVIKLTVWARPWPPVVVSGSAVGAGGLSTVGVIVELIVRFRESVAWYVTGVVVVPENVGSGLKVTAPVEVLTV
jgi:hypothetical protein